MDKKYKLDKRNDDAQQTQSPTTCENTDERNDTLKKERRKGVEPIICLLIFYAVAGVVSALQFSIYVGMEYEDYDWSGVFMALFLVNSDIVPILWLKDAFTQPMMPHVVSLLPTAAVMSFADIVILSMIIDSDALNERISVLIILALVVIVLSIFWKRMVLNTFEGDTADSEDLDEDETVLQEE